MSRTWLRSIINIRPFSPPAPYPRRNIVLLLLVTVLLTGQLHPAMLPWWARLGLLILFLWRIGIERFAWPMPARVLRWSLTGCSVVLVVVAFHGLHGRDAGTVLLVLLMGLKCLEMRNRRDVMIVVFLVWWTTLTGFLFSQSTITAASGMFCSGLALTVMIRMNQPQQIVPGRFVRDIRGLVLLAIPIMLGMYLLFPRIQGGLWGFPDLAQSGLMGLTDEVRPGSIRRLLNNDAVAFRVRFDSPVPEPQARYWRALVLDWTDGRSWRRLKERAGHHRKLQMTRRTNSVRYTTTFEVNENRWLPVLDWPSMTPDGTREGYGSVLESETVLSRPLRLEFVSHLDVTTTGLSKNEAIRNLQLARKPTTRVAALVSRWHETALDDSDVVASAMAYFRDQPFYYTLSPPLLGSRPVDEFLFETRSGYCEHYAASFTSLMRVAGIPARIVAGYQGGEINGVGGYLVVRQSDAHAWSEVWLEREGWVRVDPTAVIAPERIRYGVDLLRSIESLGWSIGDVPAITMRRLLQRGYWDNSVYWLQQRWDALNFHWNEWVMGYGPQRQFAVLAALGLGRLGHIGMIVFLVCVVGLLMLLVHGVLLHSPTPRDAEQRAYAVFLKRMARLGFKKAAWEGPVDFCERAASALPSCASVIRQVTQLYVAARYGSSPPLAAVPTIRRLTKTIH